MRRRGRRLPIAAESFHLRVRNNWFAARVCGLTETARVTLMQHFHTSWMWSQALLICLFCVRILFIYLLLFAVRRRWLWRDQFERCIPIMASTTAASAVSQQCWELFAEFIWDQEEQQKTKQNKKLNDATIESRMTATERIHTQAIEMVRVVQQQQAKCNWKVTKKKVVVLCLKTNK